MSNGVPTDFAFDDDIVRRDIERNAKPGMALKYVAAKIAELGKQVWNSYSKHQPDCRVSKCENEFDRHSRIAAYKRWLTANGGGHVTT